MKRVKRTIRRGIILISVAALVGCAARSPAPIVERNGNPARVNPPAVHAPVATRAPSSVRPATYLVQRGDTLYGIAWRYGLDHKQLADWNELRRPYTIFPSQRLRLTEPPVRVVSAPQRSEPARSSSPATATKPPPPTRSSSAPAAATKPNVSERAPARNPTPNTRDATPTQRPPVAASASGRLRWRWPTSGQVAVTFAANDPARRGVDILGTPGQPIKAAGAGEVVYSGVGLIGYGELIIIKHNQQFLSAYAHNRKRLVNEGDQVVAGQTIAEMGSSGTDRTKLHFEIRRDGKPVDPKRYLPRR